MRVCRLVVTMMTAIRRHGTSSPSLQEGERLLLALSHAEGPEDVFLLLQAYLLKEEEDLEALKTAFGKRPEAVLWGEWRRR